MTSPRHPLPSPVCVVLALLGALPLHAHACSTEPYVGEICITAAYFCPVYSTYSTATSQWVPELEYLPADGRILQTKDYQNLYTVIGNYYGGDGVTTFALPDLRGRAPVGVGQGTGLAAVATGQALGKQEVMLDAGQIPIRAHAHEAGFVPINTPVAIDIPDAGGKLAVGATLTAGTNPAAAVNTPPAKAYLSAVSAKAGLSAATLNGPYTATAPAASGKATLPADVTVTGGAPRAAASIQVSTIKDGTVDIAANGDTTATAALPTQSPALALTACISTMGTFPSKTK